MDPQERLRRARTAADEGRHEEALRDYIWFHHHALEYDRSLRGVRLSFALAYWIDLARVYPEALRALEEIRDSKTARLLQGDGDHATFHDVARINEHLECERLTSELFAQIASTFPQVAQECASHALAALVMTGDYQLARRYVPTPAETLRQFSGTLNEDVEDLAKLPPSPAPRLEAYVHIYAERVSLLLAILRGVGEIEQAERIEASALELVRSPSVREAVRAALAQRARPG